MTDILFVITSLNAGGAERVAVNLSTHWAELGYETGLVTISSEEIDSFDLHENVQRTALGLISHSDSFVNSMWQNVNRILALRKVFKQSRPRVIVSFMTTNNVMTILATLGLGCRVVVSERSHPPLMPASNLWSRLRALTYGLADVVVVLAQEGRDWILGNTRANDAVIIPNWVVWPMSSTEPRVTPESLLPVDSKILLTVGGPCDVKGHDMLLAAFSRLCENHPDWMLAIVGVEDPVLQSLIEKYNLQDRTVCTKRIGNVVDWYQKADIYALSSRTEGFPNALLEAMAAGCAPIAFDCDTGPRDILINNENGILVKDADVDGMVAGLQRLMSDDALRARLGEKASLVQATFSVSSIQRQWDKALDLCVE